jgi:hypothetical protein
VNERIYKYLYLTIVGAAALGVIAQATTGKVVPEGACHPLFAGHQSNTTTGRKSHD